MPEVTLRDAPAPVQPVQQQVQTQTPDKNMQAMVQKERQMRDAQLKWTSERDALNAKIKEYESNYIPKSKLVENPYQTLKDSGVPYDRVTEQALADSGTDPVLKHIEELRSEIKALKGGQDDSKKVLEEQQKQNQNQVYQTWKAQVNTEAKMLANSDSEGKYDSIKALNAFDEVETVMLKFYNETKEELSVEEAMEAVEAKIIERGMKYAGLSKVRQAEPKAEPRAKTLTNSMGGSKPMSAKERAILAFKGQLK